MDLLKEGGINYPIATILIFTFLIVFGIAFSLIRDERTKSISASEIHVMDSIINSLAVGMIVLFAMFF
jgi:uncharacterized membrane protein